MAKYRKALPQLGSKRFLTDGGLETTLVFHEGIELPHFAAFDLLRSESGSEKLCRYFDPYLDVASKHGVGFILETPTWRANPDWGERLGYSAAELAAANRTAAQLLHEIRDEHESDAAPFVVSGALGPRGDGYVPSSQMTVEEAQRYHAAQIEALCDADVDMLCAMQPDGSPPTDPCSRRLLRNRPSAR